MYNIFKKKLKYGILLLKGRRKYKMNEQKNQRVIATITTEKSIDELTYRKYDVYSIWHNNPESTIKNVKELQIAQSFYNSKSCKGTYKYDVVTGNSSCSERVNMLDGMTKQEKEDYFRAKDFEEEY